MVKTQQSLDQKKVVKPANLVIGKGTRITLKITALGPNNVGINEFSYAMPILVPNAKLGDTVQVQILKIYTKFNVAIAKLVKVVSKPSFSPQLPSKGYNNANLKSNDTKTKKSTKSITSNVSQNEVNLVTGGATAPVLKPGEVLDVTISKLGPNSTAIIELPNAYNNVKKLIVHSSQVHNLSINQKVSVTVTRVKTNYGFGVINAAGDYAPSVSTKKPVVFPQGGTASLGTLLSERSMGDQVFNQKNPVFKGTKFSLVLPKKAQNHF